jgi:hypothetical protein
MALVPAAIVAFGTDACNKLAGRFEVDGAYYILLATLAAAVYYNYGAVWFCAAYVANSGARRPLSLLARANACISLLFAAYAYSPLWQWPYMAPPPSADPHSSCCFPHAGTHFIKGVQDKSVFISSGALAAVGGYALFDFFANGSAALASTAAMCIVIAQLAWSVFCVGQRFADDISNK